MVSFLYVIPPIVKRLAAEQKSKRRYGAAIMSATVYLHENAM